MRKGFYIGSIAGGALGLFIALSMDLLLGGAIGSGWRDAVVHDLNALFGRTFDENSVIVITGVIAVIGLIGAFGALVGGLFGALVARFLSALTKEH